jgi:serine/threonine-protein kinase
MLSSRAGYRDVAPARRGTGVVWGLLDGRYLPLEERGRGSVAAVWRAYDRFREQDVALKVPLPRAGAPARRGLLDEAMAMCRLDHRGIVRCLGVEAAIMGPLPPGTPYLVLRHLEARPVDQAPAARTMGGIREVAHQSLAALDHLHRAGLVHRDLKPANLLVGGEPRTPRVTLVDLGSSRPSGRGRGRWVGNLTWAAPEVLRGAPAAPKGDLYALGRILHLLAGGSPPFEDDDPFGISRWLLAPRPLPEVPGLPEDLAGLIDALTRPDPRDRPATAAALLGRWCRDGRHRGMSSPRRSPRGTVRAIRSGLREAARGRVVVLTRRPAGTGACEAVLIRAALEAVRAGCSPVRPMGPDGRPPRLEDLLRAFRSRCRGATGSHWRGIPPAVPSVGVVLDALVGAVRDTPSPLVLLLEGGETGTAVLARRLAGGAARRLPGPLLVVRVEPCRGPGSGGVKEVPYNRGR